MLPLRRAAVSSASVTPSLFASALLMTLLFFLEKLFCSLLWVFVLYCDSDMSQHIGANTRMMISHVSPCLCLSLDLSSCIYIILLGYAHSCELTTASVLMLTWLILRFPGMRSNSLVWRTENSDSGHSALWCHFVYLKQMSWLPKSPPSQAAGAFSTAVLVLSFRALTLFFSLTWGLESRMNGSLVVKWDSVPMAAMLSKFSGHHLHHVLYE